MNDDYKYEPYQYGKSEEPQFEEPDLTEAQSEEPNLEGPQFEEPDLEEPVKETVENNYIPRYDYSYTQPQEPPKQEKNGKKGGYVVKTLATIALAVVFGVIASVVYQGTNRVINNYFGTTNRGTSNQKVSSTQISTNSGSTVNSTVADVAENVMPSVVSITNMSIQEVQNYFFGGTTQYESTSSGSGIIIGQNETELLIVSNNHVVEGSKSLTVTFIDGTNVEAQIKGTDSDMDLAIIAIPLTNLQSSTLEAIKIATLGDSDALRVGEPTIAIGNALGYGQSVTTGIVSALNRTIEDYEGKLVQTDAAINPGNSGGALLNANGEVIGINTAKVSADAVEGMGYAIPISDVIDILNELMSKETRTKVAESERGSIGIYGRTVDSNTSKYYNMPAGVYVSELVEGGGAEKADLPVGCIITEIDGTDIDTMEELQEELEYYRAGETVEFTIEVPSKKGYTEEKIEITLDKAN